MSISISYYGLVIHYRIEYRTKELHPTAVFHLAKPSTRHDEASRQEVIIRVPKGQDATDPDVINALIPLFLKRLDVKLQSKGTNLRLIRELPLAALWEIDQDGMREENKWSLESYKECASSFDKLISLWGDHDLSMLTPKYCSEKLLHMSSSHRIQSMIRALRLLYRFEAAFGHKVHAEWENYQYNLGRSSPSPAALRKKYVETASLSNAQLKTLFQTCYDNLSNKDGYLYFGLMLKASLLLSDSELCALQFSSFSSLTDYVDRGIVRITHEYIRQSGNKNYRRVQLADTYRIRVLPLPDLIRKAYIKLIGSFAPSGDDSPLLHHASNANRYLSPEAFASWVTKTMQAIFPELIDCRTAAKADKILYNTVFQNLAFSGLEEDEINYYRGVRTTSVASQYYCDFGNESILNRMGTFEDRWLDSIIALSPASPPRGSIAYNYRMRKMTFQPKLGHRCSLFAVIQCPSSPPIPEKPEEHLVMQILSGSGVDVSATYSPLMKEASDHG